jgi:uncharacterized protein YbbK (DUF523 family)
MVIISACLLGIKCRYDGESCFDKELLSLIPDAIFIPLCPEQLGGFSTPRFPAQINNGSGPDVLNGHARIINSRGDDVTEYFLKGAKEVKKIAQLMKISTAILKENSPSCGVNYIKRDDVLINGMGVTSALLHSVGIKLISSEKVTEDYVRYYHNRK